MNHWCSYYVCAAMIGLLVSPDRVQAWENLFLLPLEIEAVTRFDGTDRSEPDSHLRDTELRVGLRLKQEGYSLDPAIARFVLEVEPAYSWGKLETGTIKDNRSDKFLSYLFQFNLFQGTPGPVGLDLLTMRNKSLNTGSLGSRYDSEIETHTGTVNWKNRVFPMQFSYSERSLKQDFLTGATNTPSKRDDHLRTLKLKGKSSKLNLLIERQSLNDQVPDRDQDFDLNHANLSHRFAWGRASQLRSRWDYYDRTGFNANRRLFIEENVRIQHADKLFSQSSLRYFSVTQEIKTNEYIGDFRLQHQLYDNLTSTAQLFGNARRSDRLDETRWRTGLDSSYRKQRLFGATVNAGIGFSYQETERVSKLGLVEVIDERHDATLAGSVVLENRFIINSSIIVTNFDGTLVYTQDIDYRVVQLTGELTQLQVIPGGRIEEGDTLLISYKTETLPSQEFSTTNLQYNLGISFRWLRFTHRGRKSDDQLLSGANESFLKDNRDTLTNLEFRWKIVGINTMLSAERHFNKIGDFESLTYTYRQVLSWPMSSRTLINLSMLESFIETSSLNTDLYNFELSLNWRSRRGLSIRPVLGAWRRLDEDFSGGGLNREDEFLMAGVTLRWQYRKVAMDLSYHHNRRTIDTLQTTDQTTENRVMFNLSRRL